MDKFIALPEQDKRDAFQEAATRRGVLPIIIEKDFWVCWTLKQLYSIPEFVEYITFKGGTSLSKAYGLIDRFSEDIDLTISKSAPHIKDIESPTEEGISGKERQRRIDGLKEGAQKFVLEAIKPRIQDHLKQCFGKDENWKIELDNEDKDKQTLLFYYPNLIQNKQFVPSLVKPMVRSLVRPIVRPLVRGEFKEGYIKPIIRLEFGARGDTTPAASRDIKPYIAEEFLDIFSNPTHPVPTLAAERTFWEKATILHALYHGSKMRDRMSRHYYDTYMLSIKGIADIALKDLLLLDQVVQNKSVFFKDTKASYETAKIGSLKLVPREEMISELKADYKAMQEMFMADAPDFDVIVSTLWQLEEKINAA